MAGRIVRNPSLRKNSTHVVEPLASPARVQYSLVKHCCHFAAVFTIVAAIQIFFIAQGRDSAAGFLMMAVECNIRCMSLVPPFGHHAFSRQNVSFTLTRSKIKD